MKKFIARVQSFFYTRKIHRLRTKLAGYKDPVPMTEIHFGNERLAKAISRKLVQLRQDYAVLYHGAATAAIARPFTFTSRFNGEESTVHSFADADPILALINERIRHFETVKNDLAPDVDFRTIRKAAKKSRAHTPAHHAAA